MVAICVAGDITIRNWNSLRSKMVIFQSFLVKAVKMNRPTFALGNQFVALGNRRGKPYQGTFVLG